MTKFLASLGFCFVFATRSLAWNAEGHMVVAQIAYNHLDSVVKSRCDALIAVPVSFASSINSNFVTASVWADDIRSSTSAYDTWHYINLPFSLDGSPTNGFTPNSFDAVKAINQCIVTLQNTNAAATNRATSLRLLLHFVGDLQQPLHCSTAIWASDLNGDLGGNQFAVNTNSGWSQLHSLWDEGGGYLSDSINRPLTTFGKNILSNKVAAIAANYPFSSDASVIPDPMVWAVEGKNLAQTVAYVGITRGSLPTTNYLNTTIATTEQRMAIGGKRLADLLNTIFAPSSVDLSVLAVSAGNFGFSWSATPGKTYRVQWKPQVNATMWNDLADVIAATSPASFTNAIAQQQRFYRVVPVD